MGDFEEVMRLQAGIRSWLLRTARGGRHELRDIGAPAVLPLLCAAAFGPALADGDGLAPAVVTTGVLASVGADILAHLLDEAANRARSAPMPAEPAARGSQQDLNRNLERAIRRSIGEALAADGNRADDLRSDIAMVLREIDAGGTAFRAAIEAGDTELQREVLAALETLSAEFGDMAFMLADFARAAGEVQDNLSSQGSELRTASEQVRRQAADVRMIREELAVIERRPRQWLAEPTDQGPRWADGCPYRGLLPYDQAHEAVFFGRERLTAELTGMVAGTAIVMLTGASGAGKTSLLQAGLVPALARGVQVPGSSSWPVVSLTMTARPLDVLAAGLASLDGGDPAAVREMLADAPGEAHLLVREIMLRAADPARERGQADPAGDASPLVLIIDQFERVFAADGPNGTAERAAFIDAVCAAATRPAGARGEPPVRAVIAVRGDHWDQCAAYPPLVRAMEHGQLVVGPMPEAALRRVITGPAEASGLRVDGALVDAIVADALAARAGLPMLSQALALTWEQREAGRLTAAGYDRSGHLARAVEVSAEAVYADQARLVLRGQLTADTARWRQNGKDSAQLYRGVRLAAAREAASAWATDPGRYPALTAGEADFLRASSRAGTRGRWGRRILAGALVLLLIAALAGAGLAVRSARNSASQQRTEDASARLAAQSTALEAADPVTAALLAGAAWRIAPTAQARYSLLQSLAQPVRGVLAAPSGTVTAVAYSPGGKTLAAGFSGGAIRLWDVASHRLISTASWDGAPLALAFTGGGKALEVAGPATAGVWNLTSQARIAARPLTGIIGGRSVAFSPDGATLATGGDDGNVRLWDAATGQEIGAPMSSDLRPVEAVAFSPDGATVAAASSDGTVQLWNVPTHQEAGARMVAGSVPVRALAFSPGGKFLATGGDDGNVRLWNVATQSQAGATMATGASVAALSFSAGAKTLATAEGNGGAELWAFATQQQTGAALSSGSVSALAFSPGASTTATGALATGDGNGTITLWDPSGFHQSSAPISTGAPASAAAAAGYAPAAFSVRGDVLAVSDGHGTVRLWNALTRHPAGRSVTSQAAVTGLALSPDGKTLAVAGHGLQLWSVTTGQRIGSPLPAADAAGPVAFSPDGTLVAAIGTDGKARLWNVASQRETGTAVTVGQGAAVVFSPAGTIFATASANGTVTLWSVATQRRIGTPMTGGGQGPAGPAVPALAFSPAGTTLAAAGSGGTRLWDVATQQEIGTPMTAGPAPVYALAFSPGGATLVTAGGDGTARSWDVRFPAGLLTAACAVADQSLTRQQWADYAGNQPFQQVCPAS